jgi:lysophospholipase L1-like esterase
MRGPVGRRALRGLGCAVAAASAVAVGLPGAAAADGPGSGTPTVVTLGDSAISGEAGRWAGNTNQSPSKIDALGSTAYWDAPGGEAIRNCHRSRSAQAFIGGGVAGVNLACSGARTSTRGTASGEDFKPGIDFYSDAQGRRGQALALQELAATRNVTAVVVMIGANDYGFADVVTRCVQNWLTSPSWWKNYCSDDSDIASRFTAARQATETANVRDALLRVAQAMGNAGYSSSQYTIIGQTYWNPIPRSDRARYPETGFTRQTVGGCGAWNRDVNWANDVVVPAMNNSMRNALPASGLPNTVLLDLQTAFDGRRLCENTVGLLEERGVATWRSPGAVDQSEWVNQIRTVTTLVGPYQLQESIHANYWGQLAMRNCLRQVYNGGAPRGGACVRTANGLNAQGEPNMGIQ